MAVGELARPFFICAFKWVSADELVGVGGRAGGCRRMGWWVSTDGPMGVGEWADGCTTNGVFGGGVNWAGDLRH